MRRWKDWLRQARSELESAKLLHKGGFYSQSCFAAQQAAEMSVKALWEAKGISRKGHSVLKLLQELTNDQHLLDAARVLDKHYIPTRYPNGFDQGAPMDYYTEKEADDAISHAENIMGFAEEELGKLSREK